MQKSIKGRLNFYYNTEIHLIRIYKIVSDNFVFNVYGYIGDWNFEKPIDVLNGLHDSVDEYLGGKSND